MAVRQSYVQQVRASILEEFHPRHLLPSLTAGLVTGVIAVTMATAFAALIFSGPLSAYVPLGVGMMLYGAIVIGGLTALTSSLPGLVASIQETAAAILALISAAIILNTPASATPQETFITVVAAITLASFMTGVTFWLLGQFKLGNLIRFVPYPVIGGFLAGTGLLLVWGGISVMLDEPVSLSELSPLVQPDLLVRWLPGLFFGVLLLAILRRSDRMLIVPGMLLAAVAMFYVSLWLTNTSIVDATARGWLIGSLSTGGGRLWQPVSLSDLARVNWAVLGGQLGNLAVIVVVSVISILLNATGIELTTGRDVDLNRELKAGGISNLVAGLGGGIVGYHTLSETALAYRIGARGRLVGLTMAVVCLAMLSMGSFLLLLFPKPVLGGLLLYLGLDFLITWVYDAWFRLPPADYVVVIMILVVINIAGFLAGVGLGIGLAVVLFMVEYSRIDVVKHVLSGANYQSNVERPPFHRRLLRQEGHFIYILELQGFLFFGTANNLLEQVHQRINQADLPPPHFVLLDFRLVSGLDCSAVFSFAKMRQLARRRNIALVFTHLSPLIHRQLARELFSPGDQGAWHVFPDVDRGIEWCENQMLEALKGEGHDADYMSLLQLVEKALPASVCFANLMEYLERRNVGSGYYLIRQGDHPQGLYFLESGQMTVQLEHPGGPSVRLRTMGAGTVVGELGLYLGYPATASVVTDQPSTLYFLSADSLKRMEEASPEIAAALHKLIARTLGERLATMNETVEALLS